MWEMLQDGELKIWYSRRSLKKVVIRCEAAQDDVCIYSIYLYNINFYTGIWVSTGDLLLQVNTFTLGL